MRPLTSIAQRQVRRGHAPSTRFIQQRYYSTSGLHFYRNKQLELYASKNPTPLSLRQLASSPTLRLMQLATLIHVPNDGRSFTGGQ